jgi:predicted dehydrogenase
LTDALADIDAPLSWRQDAALSGFNMLSLGILHETLMRWVPLPVSVLAQVHAFVPTRIDPESGFNRAVGTPDSVQVLAGLENGARAVYQLSGVMPFNQGAGIRLYGTEGVLFYDLSADRIFGAHKGGPQTDKPAALEEIPIPVQKARDWRVEADFVDAIRTGAPILLTDFATGVRYMEFTEAVARSAEAGETVELPLEEFREATVGS